MGRRAAPRRATPAQQAPPLPPEAAGRLTGKMSVLMISEWMAATPLTAKEPTTAR